MYKQFYFYSAVVLLAMPYLQWERVGTNFIVVKSSGCENWCFHSSSQYERLFPWYNNNNNKKKLFQRQLTVATQKQTLVHDTNIGQKCFTFCASKEKHDKQLNLFNESKNIRTTKHPYKQVHIYF